VLVLLALNTDSLLITLYSALGLSIFSHFHLKIKYHGREIKFNPFGRTSKQIETEIPGTKR
jgi:hypothetical protein